MDKEIEQTIVERLKGRNHMPFHELRKNVSDILKCSEADVSRVFSLMKDRGEVDNVKDQDWLVRLTNKGLETNKAVLEKMLKYFQKNWIAIVALIISGIALLR